MSIFAIFSWYLLTYWKSTRLNHWKKLKPIPKTLLSAKLLIAKAGTDSIKSTLRIILTRKLLTLKRRNFSQFSFYHKALHVIKVLQQYGQWLTKEYNTNAIESLCRCFISDNINIFKCPLCKRENCITCQVRSGVLTLYLFMSRLKP